MNDSPKVGKSVSLSKTVSRQDVEAFAEISLDRNPVHFNEEFARATIFGKPIAHGMIGAALISGALTKLMGAGNIWLSTSIKFEKPIFIGDELKCILTITEINRRGVARIDVSVTRGDTERAISGTVESMNFVSGSRGGKP